MHEVSRGTFVPILNVLPWRCGLSLIHTNSSCQDSSGIKNELSELPRGDEAYRHKAPTVLGTSP